MCDRSGRRTSDEVLKMSKSQKKNQKRANKKGQTGGFEVEESIGAGPIPTSKPCHDPVQDLRERLAQAKADKDHDLANKLRQELWITQDLAAGYKPKLASEDKEGKEALTKVVDSLSSSKPSTSARLSSTGPAIVTSTSSLSEDERKLKTLTKKLDQIQKLKKKQEQGVTLEANQVAKIQSEQEILEDIEHLQTLLSIPAKR